MLHRQTVSMVKSVSTEMELRRERLIERMYVIFDGRRPISPPERVAWDLLNACEVQSVDHIPLKVIPLAEKYIDRVVRDYGVPDA